MPRIDLKVITLRLKLSYEEMSDNQSSSWSEDSEPAGLGLVCLPLFVKRLKG